MTMARVNETMQELIREIFEVSREIRYVAIYSLGQLHTRTSDGLQNASESETDKFEELLVNPTVLLLTKQRGDIDCGGCEYVLVRYGNFFQFVRPLKTGHLSVCIQPEADCLTIVEGINHLLGKKGEL